MMMFINVGIQAEYWGQKKKKKKPDVSGCSMLFNLIQQVHFWFDLLLLRGTYDIVTRIIISISISISIINSISTQPPSSA
jgi:hypothetical protein